MSDNVIVGDKVCWVTIIESDSALGLEREYRRNEGVVIALTETDGTPTATIENDIDTWFHVQRKNLRWDVRDR